MFRKFIRRISCEHKRVNYVGKNKKSEKVFQCSNCGLKGNSTMAAKRLYVYKVDKT